MKSNNYNKYYFYSKRLFLLLSIFLINFSISKAQSYNYSDPYSEKMLFNPAYSGLSEISEINLSYSKSFFYDIYSAGYNRFFSNYHSGLGIIFNNLRLGKGAINNLNISGICNFRFKINYKSIINTALQISYIEQSVNSEKLIFSNQINPLAQTIDTNNSEYFGNIFRTYDFSFGTTYISNRYRIGLSIHHIDKIFYNSEKVSLKPKITTSFGKIFSVNISNTRYKLLITPEIIWQTHNNFNQIIYAVHGIYNIFLTRIFVKHNLYLNTFESAVSIGLNYAKLRLTYTYNISFTKYTNIPTSTNGISLRYNFGNRKKINFKNTIYCSNF